MSTRTRAAGILTAITMTAVLAACSASDSAGDSSSDSAGESASDGGGDAATSESSSAGSTQAPSASNRELGDAGTVAGTGTGIAATPQMERAIIASGAISLTSKDVGETRREVQRIVDAEGGDITEENTEAGEDGDTSYARLVIRVPSSAFGTSMVALEKAGDLRSSTRGSDDVTTQVIDTGVRVRAQEASLKRVELLLAEADTLKDIIWIESQLTSRQSELDSLKSQQSWLADQTSLSTITVDISSSSGQVVEESPDDSPAGFVAGLSGGTKALGALLASGATVLGALLPFGALALVLGLPVWLLVRRRRNAAGTHAPTA